MRAAFTDGGRTLEVREIPDPVPGEGEVLFEVRASGMCGSDLYPYRAPAGSGSGLPIGHEPCGVVADLGPGVDAAAVPVGMRAIQHHYSGCGGCDQCLAGWTQLCRVSYIGYGYEAPGSHAQYMAVPADTLVPLPDGVSFTAGAAIACGTGTAFQALRRLGVGPGETVAVFGLGPVGLSATQFATSMGARVVGVDLIAERREHAVSMGADATVAPADGDSVEAIWDLTGGRGAACGLDATGNATARNQMVRSLGTWGRGCFVGEGGEVTLDVSDDLLRRQITLHGSWTFSTAGVAACARYVAERAVDVDRVFTHTWSLDDAAEAFRLFDAQVGVKAAILPNGGP